MKVGDLVRHRGTKALGMIIRVARNGSSHLSWHEIEWYDGLGNIPSSHIKAELELVDESR